MANVGTAPAGKTLIGQGDTTSSKFADIGTDSGLTEHGVLLAQGSSAFTATAEGVDGSLLIGATGADPAMALPTSVNDTVTFHPTANGLGFEDRRWLTAFVVDPSASVGERGTYQTIAAANAAASSGDTIFFRPGTYTENWTAKPGVNYTAFPGDGGGQVTIVGKISASQTGISQISHVELETNGDFVLEVTGANATGITLNNCVITLTDNTAISNTGSGSSSITLNNCTLNCNASGIAYFACTNGSLNLFNCVSNNSGGSTTACTFSGTNLTIRWSYIGNALTVSGSAVLNIQSSEIQSASVAALNYNSTGLGILDKVTLNSNTATALTIGAGATIKTPHLIIASSNATVISGAGTLDYGSIIQISTSGLISPTSTASRVLNVKAISFDGGTNFINSYEEGTWTPTLTGSTAPPDTITYTTQQGRYTRIGDTVYVQAIVTVNAFTLGSGAGNLIMAGLPYTAENTLSGGIWAVQTSGIDYSAGTNYVICQVQLNTTNLAFIECKDNASATVVPLSALATTDQIKLSGTYKV